MNIRFSDRHIRFRIVKQELERLLTGRPLQLDVPMPRAREFRASITVTQLGDWQLDSDPTGLWLSVPRVVAEGLSQSIPSKEGIEHRFEVGGTPLTVAVEVDLRQEKKAAAA